MTLCVRNPGPCFVSRLYYFRVVEDVGMFPLFWGALFVPQLCEIVFKGAKFQTVFATTGTDQNNALLKARVGTPFPFALANMAARKVIQTQREQWPCTMYQGMCDNCWKVWLAEHSVDQSLARHIRDLERKQNGHEILNLTKTSCRPTLRLPEFFKTSRLLCYLLPP